MRKSGFQKIQEIVKIALEEDLGKGDITSELIIPEKQKGMGFIIAKEKGIIAGLEVAKSVFKQVDPGLVFKPLVSDGDKVRPNQKVALIRGKAKSILAGERTALNFLQRLSGIATLTGEFVRKIRGTKAKILDTRKTTPGLRLLEKYAVKKGGGKNHRQGLYDMILIKDNHIEAAGSISLAIRKALRNRKGLKIEVETRNLEEIKEALNFKINRIMLDNFRSEDLKKAVKLIRSKNKKVEIEASGKVNLKNVRKIALSGVDFISVGALTHSAKALDFSLLLK
ncbi:MAG: nicotinate-nucleotide diphosphorylase (carboxylating) [candidate division Zixibacteria bacterium RBG_16_43_9]|nr:MAG: nicotinate-nucleotide diphosphorylase (carboxylating) [candidate division Zixibacteria bacterium RBG_16_43_9]